MGPLNSQRRRAVQMIFDFLSQENGASAAEYALILALVAIVIIGGLTYLGHAINDVLSHDASAIGSTTSS